MRKTFLLYLFLQNSFLILTGQNTLLPAFEIKSDTIEWDAIGSPYYQMLEDEEGKWTIDQVTQSHLVDNFHDSIANTTKVYTYWFRYSLKNTMNREARISLNSISDYDDFYVQDSTKKWSHFVSGKLNEWDKKDRLKKADCIPYPLQPNEVILIYQRTRNIEIGLPEYFELAIVSTDKTIQKYYIAKIDDIETNEKLFKINHLLEAFFIGFLLFASLFNLFYFNIVRERVYLYFTLFLFFLAINRSVNIAFSYFEVNDPGITRYLQYLTLAWVFISFFLIHFIRYFFKTNLVFKRWDRFLIGLSIFISLEMVLNDFINEQTYGNSSLVRILQVTNPYILLLLFIPLLITLFLYMPQTRNNLFTRLMIIAAFPLLSFYSLQISLKELSININNAVLSGISNFLNSNFRPIEMLSMAWFVSFSSRILFLRYSKLQQDNIQQASDKEKLIREKELERTQLIEHQKVILETQVEERTRALNNSLENLKSTQAQLIQAEKMASLGELTAGIAHEIQNPLNFVNNFSEVSGEMLEELDEELAKGDLEEVKAISSDLKENLSKINHHGRRASDIVKGMLDHSRTSNGKKVPTDINKLADEYLRLAYHGLRAKDKSFNATLETHFDADLPLIDIIPQDIGRVILNLITNAFYAVNEKNPLPPQGGASWEPTVSVSTSKLSSPTGAGGLAGGKVEIRVADNGNGIPAAIKDKIFQPFFTTKPTGQGTGLGLSLAYDIVKTHGGELKVESLEGEGCTFTISLPIV